MDSDNIPIIILVVFIVSVAMGMLVSAIAENKGRTGSRFGYFLLGFFFSLIGLIIVLVMEDKRIQSVGQSYSGLICEDCGAKQSSTNKKCYVCGGNLIRAENKGSKVQAVVNVRATQINFCSNCGAKVAKNVKFCSSCGTQLIC